MPIKYIKQTKDLVAPFYAKADAKSPFMELLWGDQVETTGGVANGRIKACARGLNGFVKVADLGDESLLEFYFIDVGQGDGVLIRTPAGEHLLIDGGYKRAAQPTGKNAADFVDWKFVKDYGLTTIKLDAMISSHNDADHYGGLWDLLNPKEKKEINADSVKVGRFYTAGVSWLTPDGKKRYLGRTAKSGGKTYLTDLLNDQTDLNRMLQPNQSPRFQGEWAKFMQTVADQGCPVERLSDQTGWLRGFGQNKPVSIRVLGPVESTINGKSALQSLGSDSQNTNGNSVLLRVDYGKARILLTGDLNAKSQAVLMQRYAQPQGQHHEFACDVVKSCHHGSDDCSVDFLKKVSAGATVISSGDAEGHAHPRPSIVAASAITGYQFIQNDKVVTPLVYSTEIARSYRLGKINRVTDEDGGTVGPVNKLRVHCEETSAGALKARQVERPLLNSYLVTGVVYGLVNVRTDGQTILCANLNETTATWDTKSFKARFW